MDWLRRNCKLQNNTLKSFFMISESDIRLSLYRQMKQSLMLRKENKKVRYRRQTTLQSGQTLEKIGL